jgi:hypothetical protein
VIDGKPRGHRTASIILTLLSAAPAFAHHSFAMFDTTKQVSLRGTVKELQWTNPHCFVQVVVADQEAPVEWSIEMNSPLDMYRSGWRPGTFKPGDRIAVVINPTRDGTRGGSLVSAMDSTGKTLTTTRPHA